LKAICWCSYLLRIINGMHGGYVVFLPFIILLFFYGGVGERELNDMNMHLKFSVKCNSNKFYLPKVGLRQSGLPLLHNDCVHLYLLTSKLLVSWPKR
jgi:hypothetical protein